MKKYEVRDLLDNYSLIKEFNTRKEAKQFIKELKEFDKRNGNPNKTDFQIEEV